MPSDIRATYAQFRDEKLLELAGQRDQLTPEASHALDVELDKRKLDPSKPPDVRPLVPPVAPAAEKMQEAADHVGKSLVRTFVSGSFGLLNGLALGAGTKIAFLWKSLAEAAPYAGLLVLFLAGSVVFFLVSNRKGLLLNPDFGVPASVGTWIGGVLVGVLLFWK